MVNEWPPVAELTRFVDRSMIPYIDAKLDRADESYLNLRPLVLNSWLKGWNG